MTESKISLDEAIDYCLKQSKINDDWGFKHKQIVSWLIDLKYYTSKEYNNKIYTTENIRRYDNTFNLVSSLECSDELRVCLENIFKNHMYQNDIETICGCLINQRTYIAKLRDSIEKASLQINERIIDVKEMNNYIRSLESKDTIKNIVIIILSITIGLMIPLITYL